MFSWRALLLSSVLITAAIARSEASDAGVTRSERKIQVDEVRIETSTLFSEVLSRLEKVLGNAPAARLDSIGRSSTERATYEQNVQNLLGSSGFVLLARFDHGSWLPQFGIRKQLVRLVIGNPLVAIRYISQSRTAGLFVPVEFLIEEQDTGTAITYLRPSSLMPQGADSGVDPDLDGKLERLLQGAVSPQ